MLGINIEDVIKTLMSVKEYLVVIGVVIALALLVTIAAHWVKKPVRQFVRSQSWIAVILIAALSIGMMLFGPLRNIITLSVDKHELGEAAQATAESVAHDVAAEGVVLLKNSGNALPLTPGNVNVFGWASSNPIYGGTGSGSMSDAYERTSILDGLARAGFRTNSDLTSFYTAYRADRPVVGMRSSDWTLPEPPAATYGTDLLKGVTDFSDTSIVVLGRSGGEGYDLPKDVNAEVKAADYFTYTENSSDYTDFEDGQSYLSLTHSERDMIALAKSHSSTVVVIYNGANTLQLNELADDPQIAAIVWAPPLGQVGFAELGKVLAGEINPSGRTPDTFARDLTRTPSFANFGSFTYTNMDEFQQTSAFANKTTLPSFVNYSEGIYVGYRFYETAAAEGLIDYDREVLYPFGYGLSYTTFEQTMGDIATSGDSYSVDVTVTNTGTVPGKDVVQLYVDPPYTDGGIEKSSANLVAYAKTSELAPGASETLTLDFTKDDLASYDAKGAKAYVVEAGDYTVSINANSHERIASKTLTLTEATTYDREGATHNGDLQAATNQFDYADDNGLAVLSHAGHFANYEEAIKAPQSSELADEVKARFVANSNYHAQASDDASAAMPKTGVDHGLQLGDLVGVDYNDKKWDELVEQMSIEDMNTLIGNAGYQTRKIGSVGKIQVLDLDGPASLNNNFTHVGSIGLPSGVAVASTWNRELAQRFGDAIGQMGHDMKIAGWYAPAMNTHRCALGGRNFEYFSEDPILAGTMAAAEVTGAQERGVYAFIKHFAMNDQETNRTNMLMTWADEQTIREIYLRPFEEAVKVGDAHAVMSAFNYIGTTYAGATPQLLQTVLRDEWGFKGFVLTDYFAGYGYQNADQIVRGGGDAMLATIDLGINTVNEHSASGVAQMQRASKNILYAVSTSWQYADGQPDMGRPAWEWAAIIGLTIAVLLAAALEFVAVKRLLRRRRAAQINP